MADRRGSSQASVDVGTQAPPRGGPDSCLAPVAIDGGRTLAKAGSRPRRRAGPWAGIQAMVR